jgi:hypothetical protein
MHFYFCITHLTLQLAIIDFFIKTVSAIFGIPQQSNEPYFINILAIKTYSLFCFS